MKVSGFGYCKVNESFENDTETYDIEVDDIDELKLLCRYDIYCVGFTYSSKENSKSRLYRHKKFGTNILEKNSDQRDCDDQSLTCYQLSGNFI